MMLVNSLLLYFSYFVLTFLSLWIIIKYKTHTLFKAFFIPFTLILVMSTYFTIESVKGTPIKVSSLIGEFRLRSYIISRQTNQIFLWVTKFNSATPIAYVMPYDVKLTKELGKAGKRIKNGVKVIIQGNTINQTKSGRKEKGKFFNYKFKGKFPIEKRFLEPLKN